MAHYLIAQIEIADREEYAKYEAGFMDIFLTYKGKIEEESFRFADCPYDYFVKDLKKAYYKKIKKKRCGPKEIKKNN